MSLLTLQINTGYIDDDRTHSVDGESVGSSSAMSSSPSNTTHSRTLIEECDSMLRESDLVGPVGSFSKGLPQRETWEHMVARHSGVVMREMSDEHIEEILAARPPRSVQGLKALQVAVKEASGRLHERLAYMRYMLALKSGLIASVTGQVEATQSDDENTKNAYNIANAVLADMRRHPRPIISAIDLNINTRGSEQSELLSFIALHRLLHPISVTAASTTVFLEEAFKLRFEQIVGILSGSNNDEAGDKILRALFISDSDLATRWNPIQEPLPMAPNGTVDNTLTILLKVYAIRWDVSSYFCRIWTPLLPSLDELLRLEKLGHKAPITKLFTTAARLLDSIFNHEVLVAFPVAATAMCQSFYAVGGEVAVHTYLLNFLIMPNLIKLLLGDNSVFNESPLRHDTLDQRCARYFDVSTWWPNLHGDNGFTDGGEGTSHRNHNHHHSQSLVDIVWIVWRLFNGATMIFDPLSTTLSTEDFFETSPCKDYSNLFGLKIRNQIYRMQRRIAAGMELLLHMPCGIESNFFLGKEAYGKLKDVDMSGEGRKALQSRLFTVIKRPSEMNSQLVVSRAELGTLFVEIMLALDKVSLTFT